MGKVYRPPEGFNPPEIESNQDIQIYIKECDEYVQRLMNWAKEKGNCPEAGKEIRFPVADGYARYIVFSMKPVKLIHIDVSDARQFQYANRLTAKDIRREIQKLEGLDTLFRKKGN